MLRARYLAPLCVAALAAMTAGCSAPKAVYEKEDFAQKDTYSRKFPASQTRACDAGRRALLSQGYNIDKVQADAVSGHKNFVDEEEINTQITVSLNCVPDGGDASSLVFANAVQDNFSMKKSSSSVGVGVGMLGNVSLPFGSSDDSLVKTRSITVTRPEFYSGFFNLLEQYLPQAQDEPQPQPRPQAGTPQQAGDASAPPQVPSSSGAPVRAD